MTVVIMWNARIKTLYQKIKQHVRAWAELFQEEPLNEQVELLTNKEALANGEWVEWRLSDPTLIHEMETIEHDAYLGVTMWHQIDFYEDMIYNPRSFYLQGLIQRELVAFIGVRRDAKDVHISNFVVRSDWQSHGIGSRMLQQLQRLLPQLNRPSLSLEVRATNVRAQAFYQRHGFIIERVEENYYTNNHEDAYWMTYQDNAEVNGTDSVPLPAEGCLRIRKEE
ncbi:MAG: ribosomal protein S18-alanine N-acetyltransferase [Aerococcus sp.]|nr:ribosomal protein S18-alanine N-acetyltransferase [Aerococcus sp.]